MALRPRILVLLVCCLSTAACGRGPATDLHVDAPATITVTSDAFAQGDPVPVRYTCDGEGTSPPLAWAGGSAAPDAWALVVDDPDAPGGTYVHWVVLDIPRETGSLQAGAPPAGAVVALNSAGRADYAPPCPPSGEHRYRFSVYALSKRTGLGDGVALEDALGAIKAAAVGRGTLLGTYRRG